MRVSYEWDIETWEGDEIIDHDFRDRLHDFGGEKLTLAVNQDHDDADRYYRLVLVRNEGSQVEGITDRLWAYVTDDGKLPEFFEQAGEMETTVRVPKRFHREFNL